MTFLSAYEDFVQGTLAALPTAVGRLRYLAELRLEDGSYHHWGMNRTYGRERAQAAMARAHTAVALDLLRSPMREVMRQVREEAGRKGVNPADYVARLLDLRSELLPGKLGGGSVRHLNAVLETVSKLSRKARGANLPAA